MGRLAKSEGIKYQIQELQERHHHILRLITLGHSDSQIADILGCTTATIRNVKHGELGKRQLQLMDGAAAVTAIDIVADIKRLAPIALTRLEEIITTPGHSDTVVVKVAESLLDRAGHGAPKLIQGQITHAYLTKDDIEDLKKRADSIIATSTEDCEDAVFESINQ